MANIKLERVIDPIELAAEIALDSGAADATCTTPEAKLIHPMGNLWDLLDMEQEVSTVSKLASAWESLV